MIQRLVSLASLLLVLLTGLLLWERATSPSDGSVVQLSNRPWRADRMQVTFVLDADSGLRERDVVTAIDGRPLDVLADVPLVQYGRQVTYSVIRDGEQRDVAVRLGGFPLRAFLTSNLSTGIVLVSLLGLGLFVFVNRPADPAAHALLLISALSVAGTTAWLLGGQAVTLATAGPSALQLAGEVALALAWGALLHFVLVIPGTGLRTSWRAYTAAYSLPIVLHGVYLAVSLPSARSTLEAAGRLTQVSLVPSSVLPVVIAVVMVVRYRSARDRAARRRMRLVLVPFILGLAVFFGLWTIPGAMGWPVPPENLIPLLILPATLALAAAILRYRLFDIELIVRRSLLYGSLTGCVLAIYLGATWLLSGVTEPRASLGVLLASAFVALTVHPLRGYLQRRVGRLVYGERDDPYEVISRLGRIDAAAAPRAVLQDVAQTLAHTLRLPYVAIELGTGRGPPAIEVSVGFPEGAATIHPLTRGPDLLGRLILDAGRGREPFGPADQRLLDALMRQVSGAAATVMLTAQLQASREQHVLAREEERRRLHHRLHDGLGPSLAACALQMEIAKKLLREDPDGAQALLDSIIGKIQELIGEVRALVYDLRPPALDQLGLARAIQERTAFFLPPGHVAPGRPRVDVEVVGTVDRLPAAVEVAAFWIAVEAVNNAARHAGAARCQVRLTRDDALSVEVSDDGKGLPDRLVGGGGFVSMRERAEELGGEWMIGPYPGGGTVVRARLPIRHDVNRS